MGVFEAVARRVREELGEIGGGREAFGIIHRDPRPKNFVVRGGEVGLLDFDLAGRGYYLFDVAAMLLVLKNRSGGRGARMQAAFLEGYRSERPLPAGYEGHLKAFVAMLTVASVNRSLVLLDYGPPGERSRKDRFLSNAAKRLANYDVAMNPFVRARPAR